MNTQTVREVEQTRLFNAAARYPLTAERGEGCYLYDSAGKRYLDAIGGIAVNALGHCHPRITAVIAAQAARLVHTSNLISHPFQGQLAERLCEWSGLDRAFFVNSGAEAVEAAVKLARFHAPARKQVVALRHSFHGRTMGALSLTWHPAYREPFAPYADEVLFIEPNDEAALREAVTRQTSALILEPVMGEGGVYPLTDSYLRAARAITEERGALLIADEVQCGLGRTCKRFAYQWAGIQPDAVTVAKPLASGLPLGALLMSEQSARKLPQHLLGTTFGGGPLACRVALETLQLIDELLPRVSETAACLEEGLRELQLRHPVIREVRAKGMMFGVELSEPGKAVALAALERGLLINCTQSTTLRLLPPLILQQEQACEIVRILGEALNAVYLA